MRKRRVRSHIIADLSANHVERHALREGHAVDRVRSDYGVDLILWTFNSGGEVESGQVFLQLKSTDNLPVLSDGQTIAFPVFRADLELWINETMPYILAVYDAQNDAAYWLYIQSYFEQHPEIAIATIGETLTVYIPMTNVVNQAAIQTFQRFKQRVQRQTGGVIRYDER